MNAKIHNWSPGYHLGKMYVRCVHHFYYKKIVVRGKNNIPSDKPVIFALNHQNAIMDALCVVCSVPLQTVFFARADAFKNPFISKILRKLKIMPIYRQRDGFANLSKNDEAFDEAFELLKDRKSLALMPEGTHCGKFQLQPLTKGICRLVFMFQEKFPDYEQPLIVPVGINYSDYYSFRSNLFIQFGSPIQANEYAALYKINQPKAINTFRDKLSEEMQKIIITINCGDDYYRVNFLRIIVNPPLAKALQLDVKNPYDEFQTNKCITDKCNILYQLKDEALTDVLKLTDELKKTSILKNHHIHDSWNESLSKPKLVINAFLLAVITPVILPGLLVYCFVKVVVSKWNKHIEDAQFHSTVKFLFILGGAPIFTVVLWLVLSFVPLNEWIKFSVFFGIFISIGLNIWFVKTISQFKNELQFYKLSKRNDPIISLYKNVIDSSLKIFIKPYI